MGRCANVHVAIDTGMGRIGLQPEHLADVVAAVDRADHLRLEGVFTHLPVSDAPDGREFTAAEIAHFVDTVQMVETPEGFRVIRHDPEFERQMEVAREVMRRRRAVLRELAK